MNDTRMNLCCTNENFSYTMIEGHSKRMMYDRKFRVGKIYYNVSKLQPIYNIMMYRTLIFSSLDQVVSGFWQTVCVNDTKMN